MTTMQLARAARSLWRAQAAQVCPPKGQTELREKGKTSGQNEWSKRVVKSSGQNDWSKRERSYHLGRTIGHPFPPALPSLKGWRGGGGEREGIGGRCGEVNLGRVHALS